MLPALDDYEGCPDLFERITIDLDGPAFTYRLAARHVHGQPRIQSGDWRRR